LRELCRQLRASTVDLNLREVPSVSRVAVVLHERLGNWAAQLRPRLPDPRIRWVESRSRDDLAAALLGLASPVVLIDLAANPVDGLHDLVRMREHSPGARVLVLDPGQHEGISEAARELGATLILSGFVPPPEVARLLERWIALSLDQSDHEGWSRPLALDSPSDAEGWLALAVGQDQAADGLMANSIRDCLPPESTRDPVVPQTQPSYRDQPRWLSGPESERCVE
jgi:hypothetical protein